MNNLTEKWTKDTSEVICFIAHFKILIVDNMLVTSNKDTCLRTFIIKQGHTRSVLILNVNVEK